MDWEKKSPEWKWKVFSKVIGEIIDIQVRIFNLFSSPDHKHSGTIPKTQVTPGSSCQYQYWPTFEKCSRPLLKGYDKCFWHAQDVKKYDAKVIHEYFGGLVSLKEAMEAEVTAGHSLEGAYLRKAPISGSWDRGGPLLPKANLRRANLSETGLNGGTLNGADLALANMEGANLGEVDIRGANILHAVLYNAKFRNNDFTGVKGLTKSSFRGWKNGIFPIYRILESYPDQCESIYRALVRNFAENGLLDDASWAAYKAKLMRHRLLLSGLNPYRLVANTIFEETLFDFDIKHLPPAKHFRIVPVRWLYNLIALLLSYLSRFTWGYGEKPLRVAMASVLVIMVYAAVFTHFGALGEAGFRSALYFSIVTFTTLGYGDVTPKGEFRLFAASEAVFGLILVGLFLFTLARRASGRG